MSFSFSSAPFPFLFFSRKFLLFFSKSQIMLKYKSQLQTGVLLFPLNFGSCESDILKALMMACFAFLSKKKAQAEPFLCNAEAILTYRYHRSGRLSKSHQRGEREEYEHLSSETIYFHFLLHEPYLQSQLSSVSKLKKQTQS